jgi:beta-lactam-binding protein with PASTA domain
VVPGNNAVFATVPNVLHGAYAQASATLRAAGFPVSSTYVSDPTCKSVGLVVGEQPSAGALTLAGSYVTLSIAKAPSRGCL